MNILPESAKNNHNIPHTGNPAPMQLCSRQYFRHIWEGKCFRAAILIHYISCEPNKSAGFNSEHYAIFVLRLP